MPGTDDNELLSHAVRMYEEHRKRFESVTSKATSQIGFVGVIIAILGFVFGDSFAKSNGVFFIIIGLTILLISIGMSIFILFPKERFPMFDVKKYEIDRTKAKKENELDAFPTLLDMYSYLSKQFQKTTKSVNRLLAGSYILTIIGLAMAFLGIIVSIK